MITLKERFIVDENGQRVGVLLDIEDYRRLLEEVEELEAIRAYDAAKASGDEAVPLEQALRLKKNPETKTSGAHNSFIFKSRFSVKMPKLDFFYSLVS